MQHLLKKKIIIIIKKKKNHEKEPKFNMNVQKKATNHDNKE